MTRRRWFPALRARSLRQAVTFKVTLATGFVCAPYWRPWCINAFNRIDWPAVVLAVEVFAAVMLIMLVAGACLWGAVVRTLAAD